MATAAAAGVAVQQQHQNAAAIATPACAAAATAAGAPPRLPIAALPLAPSVRQALLTAGYGTAADLEHLTPQALAAGLVSLCV
jgi:hypothetical protein